MTTLLVNVRLTILAFGISVIASLSPVGMYPQALALQNTSPRPRPRPRLSQLSNSALIVPGKSVGPLTVGSSREMVEELFPLKQGVDQLTAFTNAGPCPPRTEINWVDLGSSGRGGNMFIYLRDGHVFQIASATPRFHTAKGVTTNSSPASVRAHYKGMEAFLLTGSGSEALGGRSLVYWVSEREGIAFSLAYDRKTHRRVVYEVVVFEPGSAFLAGGCELPPQERISLPPGTE